MMYLSRAWVLASLAGLTLLVPVAAIAVLEAQTPKANSRAVEAARKRQERTKTLFVEYKRNEVTAAGAITGAMPKALKRGSNVSIPAKETTLESVSRLILDAKKFRIEEHHPAFHFPSGEILPENLVLAYDGTIGRIYAPDGLRKGLPPKGGIQGDACHQIKLIHLMPLLLTFRGTSSLHSSYVVGDMQPTGRSLSIDGSRCDEYHIQFSPNRIERFWLDPGKDYVLKRHQRQIDQTDVAYRHDANWGWVPTSWKRTEYTATKKVAISTTINVVDLRINEAQPDYLFAPEFPPGTHVEDQRDNKSYIIQTDGSMREASRSGELLPGSTPQPGVGWVRRHQWLLITGGAAFIGVFGYLIYRQRSRGR